LQNREEHAEPGLGLQHHETTGGDEIGPLSEARMAASSFLAAPLDRKFATTASSIASEIAKNHDTGRRLMLSLRLCTSTYLL
jgi:hypothetical protein